MNTFKLFFRNLGKNKVFFAVTIGGFAVSLAVVLILISFLVSEFTYDDHIPDIDRIYRLGSSEKSARIPEEARKLILERIPEVQSAAKYIMGTMPVVHSNSNYQPQIIHTDEGIFDVLSIPIIVGKQKNLFDDNHNIVITKKFANKLFGDDPAIGKTINLGYTEQVTVVSVIENFPEQSSLQGDILCSSELKLIRNYSCVDETCFDYYSLLLKLKPSIEIHDLNKKITAFIPKLTPEDQISYSLYPYKNVYFDTSLKYDNLNHANVKLVSLLGWLTFALLFMAIFNYINLSISHNTSRLKEHGMKKILGAKRKLILLQFIKDTFVMIIMAFILALIISYLMNPFFEKLLDDSIAIKILFENPFNIIVCIACLIVIAIVTGLYPALLAIRVNAKDLLQKKQFRKERIFDIQKLLNVIQFAASIILLICLIAISRQVEYVKSKDYGFNSEQLVHIPIHYEKHNKMDILSNRLMSIPGIVSICPSHGGPGRIMGSSSHSDVGTFSTISSDHRFVETMELTIIEGRNFRPSESNEVVIINESGMEQLGWESLEGQELFGNIVVGVVKDFHFESLYNEIGALAIYNGDFNTALNIRIQPQNIKGTMNQIESSFKEIMPDHDFNFTFYDDYLDSMYKQEEKRAYSIKIIAVIIIFISCIGLFGLVESSVKNKIKEIGIRKVNGAKIQEVMAMLNGEFVTWVFVAFIIAGPVGWYIMDNWLENFAYKTELSWWIFGLAGFITLSIALLTVSWQSWRAASRNPVEALRYE